MTVVGDWIELIDYFPWKTADDWLWVRSTIILKRDVLFLPRESLIFTYGLEL